MDTNLLIESTFAKFLLNSGHVTEFLKTCSNLGELAFVESIIKTMEKEAYYLVLEKLQKEKATISKPNLKEKIDSLVEIALSKYYEKALAIKTCM